MLQRIPNFSPAEGKTFAGLTAAILLALSLGCRFTALFAQQPGQRTFASPDDAGSALFAAMQAEDSQTPLSILGPTAKEVLSSGDPGEDADTRETFVVKYQEMHRFVKEANGAVALIIGAENWPFPIPLVNNHGNWYFDTDAGKDEILFRRIGRNELAAMEACRQLVEAEREYFSRPTGRLSQQFAQKLVSDKGRHDGLYWHGAYNEFDSPIDPLIAYANQEDAKDQTGDPVPFDGYFFRILTSQGAHAVGGAKSYISDGKMTGGVAFVAYPAEYRSSGVVTFIIDESGTIYEKDLGANTSKLAQAMTAYDPDQTWHQPE